MADKWTPESMQKKVEKERKTISTYRIAEGQVETEEKINSLTSKTDKIADEKIEPAITKTISKEKPVPKKKDDEKTLYDKVVKDAIAKAKKTNKVMTAVKKVEKNAEKVKQGDSEEESKPKESKQEKKEKAEKESKAAEFKEAREKTKKSNEAAK